jgi:hypothetical protein
VTRPHIRKTWAPFGHRGSAAPSFRVVLRSPRAQHHGHRGHHVSPPNFSAICEDRLSCWGTEGKFIGVGTSRLFSAAIPGPCAYHAGCALRWHASSSQGALSLELRDCSALRGMSRRNLCLAVESGGGFDPSMTPQSAALPGRSNPPRRGSDDAPATVREGSATTSAASEVSRAVQISVLCFRRSRFSRQKKISRKNGIERRRVRRSIWSGLTKAIPSEVNVFIDATLSPSPARTEDNSAPCLARRLRAGGEWPGESAEGSRRELTPIHGGRSGDRHARRGGSSVSSQASTAFRWRSTSASMPVGTGSDRSRQ